jgi:hypothetical protein
MLHTEGGGRQGHRAILTTYTVHRCNRVAVSAARGCPLSHLFFRFISSTYVCLRRCATAASKSPIDFHVALSSAAVRRHSVLYDA